MSFFEHALWRGGRAAHGTDAFALQDRLHALFSRYGLVRRLDLVRADQAHAQRVMCFLRMGSPEQEQAVVDALGLGRFGGDLVMVLSLDGAEPSPILPVRSSGGDARAPDGPGPP